MSTIKDIKIQNYEGYHILCSSYLPVTPMNSDDEKLLHRFVQQGKRGFPFLNEL